MLTIIWRTYQHFTGCSCNGQIIRILTVPQMRFFTIYKTSCWCTHTHSGLSKRVLRVQTLMTLFFFVSYIYNFTTKIKKKNCIVTSPSPFEISFLRPCLPRLLFCPAITQSVELHSMPCCTKTAGFRVMIAGPSFLLNGILCSVRLYPSVVITVCLSTGYPSLLM